MEKKELINWAIKGLEKEIIKVDSAIYNAKFDLRQFEQGERPALNPSKLRKRIEENNTLLDELKRKKFELQWELDLNE